MKSIKQLKIIVALTDPDSKLPYPAGICVCLKEIALQYDQILSVCQYYASVKSCDDGDEQVKIDFIPNSCVFQIPNETINSGGVYDLTAKLLKQYLEALPEIGSGNVEIL
jgi:hypothetical protein